MHLTKSAILQLKGRMQLQYFGSFLGVSCGRKFKAHTYHSRTEAFIRHLVRMGRVPGGDSCSNTGSCAERYA